jgi:hypothetical protein
MFPTLMVEMGYSPSRYLGYISQQFSVPGHPQDRLASDKECDVSQPNAIHNRNDYFVFVPNSDSGGMSKRLASGQLF